MADVARAQAWLTLAQLGERNHVLVDVARGIMRAVFGKRGKGIMPWWEQGTSPGRQ